LQQIWREAEEMVAVRRTLGFPAADDLDAVPAHQTTNATQANLKVQLV
jgi:hypothetical protein